MEKLIYLIWKPQGLSTEAFRHNIITQTTQALAHAGASKIRLTVSDSDIDSAKNKRLISAQLTATPDALVSLWLNSAATQHQAIETILDRYCHNASGYLVTESEPVVNTLHPTPPGQRTPGMNQVVFLRTPSRLTRKEWLDLWLNQHTLIAIATQSTFGYRQNVVMHALTNNALTRSLVIDAIVEENFPAEAMTSQHAFYKANGDDALLRKNQTAMFTSVQRFIDLDKIDCLPMSEYNF